MNATLKKSHSDNSYFCVIKITINMFLDLLYIDFIGYYFWNEFSNT